MLAVPPVVRTKAAPPPTPPATKANVGWNEMEDNTRIDERLFSILVMFVLVYFLFLCDVPLRIFKIFRCFGNRSNWLENCIKEVCINATKIDPGSYGHMKE